MDEQRYVRLAWCSGAPTSYEISLEFLDGISRQGHEARLVKFRLTHMQNPIRFLVVTHGEPHQLATAKPGRVEDNETDSGDLTAEGRCLVWRHLASYDDRARDIGFREDIRQWSGPLRRELCWIGHEGPEIFASAKQTEIIGGSEPCPAGSAGKRGHRFTPSAERLARQVRSAGRDEEAIEVAQRIRQ
jgi:hypothetical protein